MTNGRLSGEGQTTEGSDSGLAGGTRRSFLRAVAGGCVLLGVGRAAAQDDGFAVPPTLPSAERIDRDAGTVTLPVYLGRDEEDDDIYFVVTEASDPAEAVLRGTNWAPKLANARGTEAVQQATGQLQSRLSRTQSPVTFDATVDFAAVDGDAPAVGESGYSPLFATDGPVYNAPHVANTSGRHPAVVSFDRDDLEATLDLTVGFHGGRRVRYLATDAGDAETAALAGATHAPALSTAPAPGDRALETSAREAIFAIVNGPTGEDNPQRQGIESALAGEGDPLNVTRSAQICREPDDPTACSVFYSPLWDVYEMVWTLPAEERRRLTSHEAVIERALAGDLRSATPDGPVNTLLANVPASGAVLDAPLIDYGDGE